MNSRAIGYAILLSGWCGSKAHAQPSLDTVTSSVASSVRLPWYASAHLGKQTFEIIVLGHAPGLTGTGPRFAVGRWLTPRWAVEGSYAMSHFLDERTNSGTMPTGETYSRYTYAEDWVKAASVLLRRRLTRKPSHRFQFDGLAGITGVHYRDKLEIVEQTNGQVKWQNKASSQATNAYLTLGPAVAYKIGQHVEVTSEFLFTKNLRSIDRTFSTQQLNSTLGFQRGWNLGLRYRFAAKRKAAAEGS